MSGRDPAGRFPRVRRRADHWSSPHERARVRAAELLEAPLRPKEARWLDDHLAGCDPCRDIAEAYATDRLALRLLRDGAPEPPRDLWARTAAGIERESAARRRAARPRRARRTTSAPALAALSGLAVAAVVVVATAISGGFFGPAAPGQPSPSVALASLEIAPQPTAIAVGAGEVHWLGAGEDGIFAYNVADIDAVCPLDRQPDCAPIEDGHSKRVALSATPRFVFQSPVDDQAVIVGTDASGADAVIVVALPTPDPTPVVPASPGPEVSPQSSELPDLPSSSPPSATPIPTPAAVPSTDLPIVPPSDLGSAELASFPPSESGEPSSSPGAEPTSIAAVAIITNVTVVGRAAAYSADGAWFAFSARPADGSAGPDIYVWHVGELQARALTTDHASVFASWVGDTLLGSRLSPDPVGDPETTGPISSIEPSPEVSSIEPSVATASPSEVPPELDPSAPPEALVLPERVPQTFLLDPWTGIEIAQLEAEWQPAVDPTGFAVVAWQGTVRLGEDGLTAAPATGNLVIHPFHGLLQTESLQPSPSPAPDATLTTAPSPIPTPAATASADASPSTSPPIATDFPPQVLAAGPIADFDARWDDTGTWLAIWIADAVDPALGRLSLLHFDPATGIVDRPIGAPQDVTAMPGFSIGLGRLAWASPPGQGGEGSRIQIAAWTSNEVGAVESVPVEGAIVVQ